MSKVNTKTAALGAVGALVLAGLIALVANAQRVCATVVNPTGRAICETIVETAKESRVPDSSSAADAGVDVGL